MSFTVHGVAVSRGVGIGPAHVIEHDELVVPERSIPPDGVAAEQASLVNAVAAAREQLKTIRDGIPADTPAEITAFIDTHLLMLDDEALTSDVERIISEQLCNAAWALKKQRDALVAAFDAMEDPYLATRRDDVEHVISRIQGVLLEQTPPALLLEGANLHGKVVVADELTAADIVLMQQQGVAAFATEGGAPTSHMSILARSLGIPGVVGARRLRSYLRADEELVVDGNSGIVAGDVSELMRSHYRRLRAEYVGYIRGLDELKGKPARTADGVHVELHANVELPSDFDALLDVGASGVGLYRTEFLYLNQRELPDEEAHFEAYARLLEAARGTPITIRTVDIGSDKRFVSHLHDDANPALGLRAIRLALKEPKLFWPQLRAIIRASGLGPVRLMIPMLSVLQEARKVVESVRGIQAEFERDGVVFDVAMPIGGMIEVPATAVCADAFAAELDFLSIGTNDLIQYTLAIDRLNDDVAYLYDPTNPAVLRLISATIKAGSDAGIPVAMCGEMASDRRYTKLLLGIGLREFSVHPSLLLEIKQAIRQTNLGAVTVLARALVSTTEPTEFERLKGLLQ